MNKSIFVVAALLVAGAASQSLDILTRYNNQQQQQQDVFNPALYARSLRRLLGHPLERSFIYGGSLQVPNYLRDDIFDVNVLQIQDFVMHPLFPVYMGLPYFQQYWSYPMFQRYVCSQYFQRFWELPSFQQYFIQPALFYKYIYPLVNIFNYDVTPAFVYPFIPTQKISGGYPFYLPIELPQQQQQQPISSLNNVLVTPEEDVVEEETVLETVTDDNDDDVVQSESGETGDAKLVDESIVDEVPSTNVIPTASVLLPEQQVFNPYVYNRNNNYYSRYPFNPLVNVFRGYHY